MKIIMIKNKYLPFAKSVAVPDDETFAIGDAVVFADGNGLHLAQVERVGGKFDPTGEVVFERRATTADIDKASANENKVRRARRYCASLLLKHNLELEIVDVYSTLDYSKVTFYFTANGRVDFRDLVKDLASELRTRIEMHQINEREEIMMCGGIGPCGQPCCCKRFLGKMGQVSIKMAKNQGIALNPNKINGYCGKLMCCLAYENDVYLDAMRAMPKVGTTVNLPTGETGVVHFNKLLERIVTVELIGDNAVMIDYPLDELQACNEHFETISCDGACACKKSCESAEPCVPDDNGAVESAELHIDERAVKNEKANIDSHATKNAKPCGVIDENAVENVKLNIDSCAGENAELNIAKTVSGNARASKAESVNEKTHKNVNKYESANVNENVSKNESANEKTHKNIYKNKNINEKMRTNTYKNESAYKNDITYNESTYKNESVEKNKSSDMRASINKKANGDMRASTNKKKNILQADGAQKGARLSAGATATKKTKMDANSLKAGFTDKNTLNNKSKKIKPRKSSDDRKTLRENKINHNGGDARGNRKGANVDDKNLQNRENTGRNLQKNGKKTIKNDKNYKNNHKNQNSSKIKAGETKGESKSFASNKLQNGNATHSGDEKRARGRGSTFHNNLNNGKARLSGRKDLRDGGGGDE